MPKPFPFPLAVGTDICSIPRIKTLLAGKHGIKFIRKVLREEERVENKFRCDDALEKWRKLEELKDMLAWKGQRNNMHVVEGKLSNDEAAKDLQRQIDKSENEAKENLGNVATFMAGRFAAKEAIIKAHQRRLYFHDISIRRPPEDESGSKPPIAVVLSNSKEWEDGQEVKLSISHDADYATAVCLAPTTTSTSKPFDQKQPSVRRVSSNKFEPGEERTSIGITGKMLSQARKAVLEHRYQISHAVRVDDIPFHYTASHLSSAFQERPIFSFIGDANARNWGIAIFKNEQDAIMAAAELNGRSISRGQIVRCTYIGDRKLTRQTHEAPVHDTHSVAIELAKKHGYDLQNTIRVEDSWGIASRATLKRELMRIRLICNGRGLLIANTHLHGASRSKWGLVVFSNAQDAFNAAREHNGQCIPSSDGDFTIRCTYLGDEKNDLMSTITSKALESNLDGNDQILNATQTLVETVRAKVLQNENLSSRTQGEESSSNAFPNKPVDFPSDRTVRIDSIPANVDLPRMFKHLSRRAVKVHFSPESRCVFLTYVDAYTAIVEFVKRHNAAIPGSRGVKGHCAYLGGDIDVSNLRWIFNAQPYDRSGRLKTLIKKKVAQALKERGLENLENEIDEDTSDEKDFFGFPEDCVVRIDNTCGLDFLHLNSIIKTASYHRISGSDSAFACYATPEKALYTAAKYDGYCIKDAHAIKCVYMGPQIDMIKVRRIVCQLEIVPSNYERCLRKLQKLLAEARTSNNTKLDFRDEVSNDSATSDDQSKGASIIDDDRESDDPGQSLEHRAKKALCMDRDSDMEDLDEALRVSRATGTCLRYKNLKVRAKLLNYTVIVTNLPLYPVAISRKAALIEKRALLAFFQLSLEPRTIYRYNSLERYARFTFLDQAQAMAMAEKFDKALFKGYTIRCKSLSSRVKDPETVNDFDKVRDLAEGEAEAPSMIEVETSKIPELLAEKDGSTQLTELGEIEESRQDNGLVKIMNRLSMLMASTSTSKESQKHREGMRPQLIMGRPVDQGKPDRDDSTMLQMMDNGEGERVGKTEQIPNAHQERDLLLDEQLIKDEKIKQYVKDQETKFDKED